MPVVEDLSSFVVAPLSFDSNQYWTLHELVRYERSIFRFILMLF